MLIAMLWRNRLIGLTIGILFALSGMERSETARSAVVTDYDLVILHGRVLDPESGFDSLRNIGIANGVIRAITTRELTGRMIIEAKGLVLSPGFIDLHQHTHDLVNHRLKAMDGVTTAIEFESGTADVDQWYAEREGKSLINFGVSSGHLLARMAVMRDPGTLVPVGDAASKAASEDELRQIKHLVTRGLERGGVAVGLKIEWTPAASPWEILEMFRIAAKFRSPVYSHLRYQGSQEPESSVAALNEMVAAAAMTGVPLHLGHIPVSGLRATPQLLQMISEARSKGMDVTADVFPYTFGSSPINSLNDGWQKKLGLDFRDLQLADTGERLSVESFAQYRKTGRRVIIHNLNSEDEVAAAIRNPALMIASDGRLEKGVGHPRTAGTFSRVLGHYVREAKVVSLKDALRKMTFMPAQRLERRVPMMKNKGRIRVGADADITIFDPKRIRDKATVEEPAGYSEGIRYVLVNGTPVVQEGQLHPGVSPGKPIRAPFGRNDR